jgi:tetratricopeptide (TPR) repeat protein
MIKQRDARERIAHWSKVAEDKPDSAGARFNLGLAYTALGRQQQAETAYREALELDPALSQAWINLGGVLLLKWDFKGALEANSQALRLDPNSLLAHYNAGQAHLYLGNPEGVVAANRRVIELDPHHAAGHYFLAVGLLAMNQSAPARAHLHESIRLGHKPEPSFLKAIERAEQGTACAVPALEIGH